MPAKDVYHDNLKRALVSDGWTITHDPLTYKWGKKDIYVDLGAEQFIAAEKHQRRIAVEVKSFISDSEVEDLKTPLDNSCFTTTSLTAWSRSECCTWRFGIPHSRKFSRNRSERFCSKTSGCV